MHDESDIQGHVTVHAAPPSALLTAQDLASLVTAAAACRSEQIKAQRAAVKQAAAQHRQVAGVVVPKDYVPSAESAHELYQLALDSFEGPLDLLLFLIKRHQLDIFDIPIAFICARYLDCLAMMKELNIDVAAEFLYMASELVHIKSRLLLPQDPDTDDEAAQGDPRAALVARLLEYQTYKDAAHQLQLLPHLGRDVFARQPEPLPAGRTDKKLRDASVFALVQAFNAVLQRHKPEVRHRVAIETVSMRQRMLHLIDALNEQEAVLFSDLLADLTERLDIIVTFLAVLEMTRMKLLRVYESDEGYLYVHARFTAPNIAVGQIAGIDEHQYAG